jgi:ATP-dependent Clp protease ATP-binding subunit ClpX
LIKQYKKIVFWMKLHSITDEALDFIVDKALEYKLGARGLRSLCEYLNRCDVQYQVLMIRP